MNRPPRNIEQQDPLAANLPGASGSDLTSLRRPLIVLAIGTFAIDTDAFVIGDVRPALARNLGVATSSAGLLVTGYAIGGPALAIGTAPSTER
jgi:predicted MFS family arabinose efflux permease